MSRRSALLTTTLRQPVGKRVAVPDHSQVTPGLKPVCRAGKTRTLWQKGEYHPHSCYKTPFCGRNSPLGNMPQYRAGQEHPAGKYAGVLVTAGATFRQHRQRVRPKRSTNPSQTAGARCEQALCSARPWLHLPTDIRFNHDPITQLHADWRAAYRR